MTVRLLRQMRADELGATIIEFAIILPTFMLLMMGCFDVGYQIYLRATLSGAVQEAARASALETGPAQLAAIDRGVTQRVQNLAYDADVTFSRKNYYSYNDIGRAETFADGNGNNVCDNNETYEDENSNGRWDSDVGASGIGGARDVVLYEVRVGYDRLFPLWRFVGGSQRATISTDTVLKNQPFALQDRAQVVARTCS